MRWRKLAHALLALGVVGGSSIALSTPAAAGTAPVARLAAPCPLPVSLKPVTVQWTIRYGENSAERPEFRYTMDDCDLPEGVQFGTVSGLVLPPQADRAQLVFKDSHNVTLVIFIGSDELTPGRYRGTAIFRGDKAELVQPFEVTVEYHQSQPGLWWAAVGCLAGYLLLIIRLAAKRGSWRSVPPEFIRIQNVVGGLGGLGGAWVAYQKAFDQAAQPFVPGGDQWFSLAIAVGAAFVAGATIVDTGFEVAKTAKAKQRGRAANRAAGSTDA
jgi:hypothetical protein